MKGLFIPGITAEMFRNGCLESIEALMSEGEIYDIDYSPWIPVNERLPENTADDYLICVEDYEKCRDVYKGFYQDYEWWTQWSYGCQRLSEETTMKPKVVAWMPLPEPYKGGE